MVAEGLGFYEGLEYSSVACVDDAETDGGCGCTAAIEHTHAAEAGSYRVAGGKIVTESGAEFSYCIKGNAMVVTPEKWGEDTSMTTTGTVVLRK